MNSRVFIFEMPRRQALGLTEAFGPIVPLIVPEKRRPSVFNPTSFAEFMREELAANSFDPAVDYILLAGGLIGNALLVTAAVAAYGNVKLLLWDASAERYESRDLCIQETNRA
jgi:hypothetical protein